MADLEFWAQIMAQPGGYGRLQELVDDDERMKRQLTDAMGYLRCSDEIAGDLVKNILLSLDSNSACREGTSREARAVIRRTIDDDAFIAVLKVHAELGRSGLPVRLWSRPPNVAAPARLRAVERLANPSDDELWKYVATNTPCVVERAFEDMPCLQTFRDDDHLKRLCGHRDVLVRTTCIPDGAGRHVFIEGGAHMGKFGTYIDACAASRARGEPPRQYTGKIELRKFLPEMHAELADSPTNPRIKYGALFGDVTEMGVIMYFGGGRNTTKTHFDPFDNLMLVVDGTKKLWLWPPSDAESLYPWPFPSFSHSGVPPFLKADDPSTGRFPKYADAVAIEVEVKAGDLLFLPAFWYHCVEGGRGRNMIINWWFHLHKSKRDASTARDLPATVDQDVAADDLPIPRRREMTVQGKGAVVRSGASLASAHVATLPRDATVVIAPGPPLVVDGKERLRIVAPVAGYVSRIALCYHPPAPPKPGAQPLGAVPKPPWLQSVAS